MGNVLGGLVRTGLAAFGGYLVKQGLVDQGAAETLSSYAPAIAGAAAVQGTAAWSWWSKKRGK